MHPHEGIENHFLEYIRDEENNNIIKGLKNSPNRPFNMRDMKAWQPNQTKRWYTENYPKVRAAHERMRKLFTLDSKRDNNYN